MMNNRTIRSLLIFFSSGVILLGMGASLIALHGQISTEERIRLMSDALDAREAGDLEGARQNLLKLIETTPGDDGLQRLLQDVESRMPAEVAPPPPPAAPAPTPPEAETSGLRRAAPAPVAAPAPEPVATIRPPYVVERIRLMSDALDARAAGDFAGAQTSLLKLLEETPNDVGVQRLLEDVEIRIAAEAAPLVPLEVEVTPMPKVESDPYLPYFESLAMEDGDRQLKLEQDEALLQEANAFRGLAARQAAEGQYTQAIVTLKRARHELPDNAATAQLRPQLDQDIAELYLGYARHQLSQGDLEGARQSLDEYARLSSDSRTARLTGVRLEREIMDPSRESIEEISPGFVEEQRKIRDMIRVGRAQFLNGDIVGAENTFRQVEAMDVYNPEAKAMLARIASEKTRRNHLDRLKTRTQMIEEVGAGWQRPQIYVDRARPGEAEVEPTELERKLEQIRIPSVNFPGVDLSRAISTLSQISAEFDRVDATGVNIVLRDPDRTQPLVNISVRDLSLRRVLDLIVDSVDFQYEVEEDVVVVRPGVRRRPDLETENFPVSPATVQRLAGRAAPQQAPAQVDDPFAPTTTMAPTGPAVEDGSDDSRSLRQFLQQAAGVDFTVQGSSLIYDGTDIWVTQTPRNLERIRNVFRRLSDVRQVEIEARFLEVADSSVDELGFNWTVITPGGTPFQSANRTLAGAFAGVQGTGEIRIGNESFPMPPPTIPGRPGLGSGAPNFAVIDGSVDGFDVRAVIRMLSQRTGSDLLSAPRITVLSGHQANINVAQELRYPDSYGDTQSEVGRGGTGEGGAAGVTITPGTPQDFQMRRVGVELTVTPTVEQDHSVTLDLNPRVTEFEGFVEYGGNALALTAFGPVTIPGGFYQPIFATREINTRVNIWDGATVVMGGLTREDVRRVDDKVPFLGDVPVLGRFFRSQGEASQKRNLLIFVTANLVSPGGSPMRQHVRSVEPGALYQNPTIVLPGGAVAREKREE